MNDLLRTQWRDLLGAWAVMPSLADETFGEICMHYAEPGRFYHTLLHIGAMLDTAQNLSSFAQNLNAVKLAVWLHDVIYDSRASDNEERSAEHAKRLCNRASVRVTEQVASLIMKTKTHEAGGDPDAHVIIDADLAVLGGSESAYRVYADQIRHEYAWVPESEYRIGRRQVLERFLARPSIFHLLTDLEGPAHRNIAAEIVRLTGA